MGRRKRKGWTARLGNVHVAGGIASVDYGGGGAASLGFVCEDDGAA